MMTAGPRIHLWSLLSGGKGGIYIKGNDNHALYAREAVFSAVQLFTASSQAYNRNFNVSLYEP